MRSSNPALSEGAFRNAGYATDSSHAMTIQGTVNKSAILLLCVLLTAGWTWTKFYQSGQMVEAIYPWMIFGAIGGLITAMVAIFKKEWTPVAAPIYALLEGLFIGGFSSVLEVQFPGIVIQAASLTLGTTVAMLFCYSSGIIRATQGFKKGVIAATGGIFIVYFASFILSFFEVSVGFIHGNSLFSIGFSLFVVVIAAMNLIIDFDFIEQASKRGVPKYMEWYGAFALMVTLVWLYIEFLRLLSKTRSR